MRVAHVILSESKVITLPCDEFTVDANTESVQVYYNGELWGHFANPSYVYLDEISDDELDLDDDDDDEEDEDLEDDKDEDLEDDEDEDDQGDGGGGSDTTPPSPPVPPFLSTRTIEDVQLPEVVAHTANGAVEVTVTVPDHPVNGSNVS